MFKFPRNPFSSDRNVQPVKLPFRPDEAPGLDFAEMFNT